jgi:hypothetical protein
VFSESINLPYPRSPTDISFSTLHYLLLLNFTLVGPTLQYASVICNPATSADANELERVQQSFHFSVIIVYAPHTPGVVMLMRYAIQYLR